jgi:hypothetical protein
MEKKKGMKTMKKLLSLVLVLAIVVSCLTMIGSLAGGEATTGVINGDAEDTSGANWGVIHGGKLSIVEEPNNTSNHVAKLEASGPYHSAFVSINNALSGAGAYRLSFRIKAVEAGKGGKFNVNIASAKHDTGIAVGNSTGNTYFLCSPSELIVTDEWQTFTTNFTISQAWLDAIKTLSGVNTQNFAGATPETIGIRLDGSQNAFATTQFEYFIDDVTVEAAEGIKITVDTGVTSTNYYARAAANFTAADVVDGKISRTYEVINDSDQPVKIWLRYQGGDNKWKDLYEASSSKQKTIPAKSKEIFNLSFSVTNEGVEYGKSSGTFAPLANTYLRVEFPDKDAASPAAGTVIYIKSATNNADPVFGVTAFADTGISAAKAYDIPNYAVATPVPVTPAPTQSIVNGDAEDTSKAGWLTFMGGTIDIVADPDDADNKVAHYVPRDTCRWDSIGFDMGAGIVQDELYGFYGAGAAKYTVKFRARAEEGKTGTYKFVLNSIAHYDKDKNYILAADTTETVKKLAAHSYLPNLAEITLTDEWTEYEVTFQVTETFLEVLSEIRRSTLSDAKNAYKVILRLDGSSGAYDSTEADFFGYYVDDVEIALAVEASPTPIPTHTINGDAEGTETEVWSTMHGSGNSVTLIPEPGNTTNHVANFVPGTYGYATVFYDFTNVITGPGTYNVSFRIKAADAANSGNFKVYLTSKQHKEASQVKELIGEDKHAEKTFFVMTPQDLAVSGDWVTYEGSVKVTAEYLQMLKDLEAADAANATRIGLRLDGSGTNAFANGTWAYYIDDITVVNPDAGNNDEGEEDVKVPTGMEFVANNAGTASTDLYFVTASGVLSADDIKNGEITKKFQIQNTGEEAMSIEFTMQASVNDGEKWAAPSAGERITLEPGEVAWVEYTIELNDDNTVEISGEDVALDKIFYRFNVTNGDGADEVEAGTKFIIFASADEFSAIQGMKLRPIWSKTETYSAPAADTGDVLPVAMIAGVVVAFVGLAVVAVKKRKED